ncbi:homoserine kinase [Tumebacillus flagellatus]|uniref:Homoserine kinase n=1 Tax=Tumebacillus flagellatus TaxID=1157490 RepID=A0A074LRX7_9BACL|nr:homoserine kinase [Tumebacillus flagellatus]KEO83874.1 serine kinase [Tumebacillus flagellatus]
MLRTIWRVPATTANLGPGFDVLGMALNLYNEVEMVEIQQGLEIYVEGEGAELIARDESNLVYQAALHVFEKAGWAPSGLRIRLQNQIPVTRGLGSSSAALVGGLAAANRLCGDKLTQEELLEIATEIEGHPDNVAPVLYGGLLIAGKVRGKWRTQRLTPPAGLCVVAAVPDFELPTEKARGVLPERIERADAIFTASHVALMVSAVQRNDLELFGACLEDVLHQPYRETLVPGLRDVLQAAEDAGALGAALSGAGPTLVAFTDGRREEVGRAIQDGFAAHGVSCRIMYLYPDLGGVCETVARSSDAAAAGRGRE